MDFEIEALLRRCLLTLRVIGGGSSAAQLRMKEIEAVLSKKGEKQS